MIIPFIALFLAVLLVFCIHLWSYKYISWNLHGVWITEDGKILKTSTIQISGRVPVSKNAPDSNNLELDIAWSENSPLKNEGSKTYEATVWTADNTYYVYTGFFLDQSDIPQKTSFGLSLEKRYFIVDCSDNHLGQYFLASTDPNVDTAEIWEYFSAYFDPSTSTDS